MIFGLGQNYKNFAKLATTSHPAAKASIKGSAKYPGLHGALYLYPYGSGSLVVSEVYGLPAENKTGVFAFHIHEGDSCTGDAEDPFKNAKMHYNPTNTEHPMHAGDMPPLFSNGGYAYLSFYTNRFAPQNVLGRTVIIHTQPDDFKTQPSGGAGQKIACGVIQSY